MSILLPCKPDLLLHFEKDTNRDINKYYEKNKNLGKISFPLSNAQSKFGMSSCYKSLSLPLPHTLDTTKDFTISYQIKDVAKQSKTMYFNLNKEPSSFYSSLAFGWYDSGSRLMCISSKNDPTGQNIEVKDAQIYSPSIDSGLEWIHLEYSFDSITKTFRMFRNGTIVYSKILNFYIGQVAKNFALASAGSEMYFDELLVIQNCLHKAAFTPPPEPYIWLDGPEVYQDKDDYIHAYK